MTGQGTGRFFCGSVANPARRGNRERKSTKSNQMPTEVEIEKRNPGTGHSGVGTNGAKYICLGSNQAIDQLERKVD